MFERNRTQIQKGLTKNYKAVISKRVMALQIG